MPTIRLKIADLFELEGRNAADNAPREFKDSSGARIQMAWKHGRDHHRILTRRGFAPALLPHLQAHEMTELYRDATDYAAPYRPLDTFARSQELHRKWQSFSNMSRGGESSHRRVRRDPRPARLVRLAA